MNVFGYSPEAALKIVEYGLNGLHYSRKAPRATLRRLDGLAREWSERGARTLEDVERLSAEKKRRTGRGRGSGQALRSAPPAHGG